MICNLFSPPPFTHAHTVFILCVWGRGCPVYLRTLMCVCPLNKIRIGSTGSLVFTHACKLCFLSVPSNRRNLQSPSGWWCGGVSRFLLQYPLSFTRVFLTPLLEIERKGDKQKSCWVVASCQWVSMQSLFKREIISFLFFFLLNAVTRETLSTLTPKQSNPLLGALLALFLKCEKSVLHFNY